MNSDLDPTTKRSTAKESDEEQASLEPPAKSWLLASAKAFTIADLRISYVGRKETWCIFVKALFERSASSALT